MKGDHKIAVKLDELDVKFAATFNQAAVGMAHVGFDGRFLLVNQKFSDITGYTCDELLNFTFKDITHPDDVGADLQKVEDVLSGKIDTYDLEKRYVHKTGAFVWIKLTVSLVRNGLGESKYFIGVIEDIGRRKRIEKDLVLAHEKLEATVQERTLDLELATLQLKKEIRDRQISEIERNRFFTISQDAMVILGEDGTFQKFNPAFERLLGYSEKELGSFKFWELIHPDDRESSIAVATALVEMKHLSNFENRYLKKDGSCIRFSWTATIFVEQKLIYAIARDVTELRHQEYLRQEEHIKAASASKMQALGRMAAGMAHEINNPLTIVYGQAHILKRISTSEEFNLERIRSIAGQLEDMSLRIVTIINGLRTFARDGSRDPLHFISLKKIVADTLSFSMGKMQSEGLTINVAEIPESVEVHCRAVQISQVLLNLLNNARDALAGKENGSIEIEFIDNSSHTGIAVCDNGNGVSEEIHRHLFEPFYTSKEVDKGTGLGLSVSRGIISAHSGLIFHDETFLNGARFVFLLPKVT